MPIMPPILVPSELFAIQNGLRKGLVFYLQNLKNLSAVGQPLKVSDQFEVDVWVWNGSYFCAYSDVKTSITAGKAVKAFAAAVQGTVPTLDINQRVKLATIRGQITRDPNLLVDTMDEFIKVSATAIAELAKVKFSDWETEVVAVAAA